MKKLKEMAKFNINMNEKAFYALSLIKQVIFFL